MAAYLRYPHTLKNYEKEHRLAGLFDKHFRGPWETAGAKRIEEVAKRKVREILSKHEAYPLDADLREKPDGIVRREERAH